MQKSRITNGECSRMDIFLIMTLVYMFGVACRFFWIYWASGIEQFSFDGELIMTTNDAFASAEGARDMIAGFHQPGDLSPYGASIPTLAFLLSKILPVSLNSIAIYMSVFLAPLVAVPIILIAREYKILGAGIIAALLACVLPGYYIRTLGGYFDSDMLNIVLPMLAIWALIRLTQNGSQRNLILPAVFMALYDWWYPSSYSLNLAITIMFLFYALIFDRRNEINYKAVILMAVSVINFNTYYGDYTIIVNYILLLRIVLIASLYFLMIKVPSSQSKKILWILGALIIALYIAFGGLDPIITQIESYFGRGRSNTIYGTFHFYGVRKTVNEVANADFMKFVHYCSGNIFIFICAMAGLAFMFIKFRSFILSLPMIALGFLALFGGVRFAMYMTPMIAFGFAYFVYFTLNYFEIRAWLKNSMLIVLTCLALLPSLDYIYKFRVAPVLMKDAVAPLAELKNKADREDYVLSWWDYGYLIRYYSDVKVVADPGDRQIGIYSFLAAFSINKDQISSANMARLNVEYIERDYGENNSSLLQMQKDYNELDINKFLKSLGDKNFKLPKKTKEVYYYFVPHMIDMLPNILKISNIDIATGEEFWAPLAYIGYNIKIGEDGVSIIVGSECTLPSADPEYLIHDGKKMPINSYYQVGEVNGKLVKLSKQVDKNSNLYVIFLPDYQRILVLDETVFNSTFIQLFVLENYDKELFEPVYLSNSARIYKLLR